MWVVSTSLLLLLLWNNGQLFHPIVSVCFVKSQAKCCFWRFDRQLRCFSREFDHCRIYAFFVLIFWAQKCACASFYAFCMSGFTFNCEKCSYKALNKSSLENHILVHHNGVTFDCHICQHKSNRKASLNFHIKIKHEGQRYECHECDVVFTGKQGVRRHVKSVHKGLKIDCDMCELKLSSASCLSTHKKRVHFKATVWLWLKPCFQWL